MHPTIRPGDHLSTAAIGDAAEWFAATLKGGTPRPRSDRAWYWKEAGVSGDGPFVGQRHGLQRQRPLALPLRGPDADQRLHGVLGVTYAVLFMTGSLIIAFDPLSTVILLQFVPVLAAVTIIATFTWQRTGGHRAGGLITGLLVTLYAVAGTATQV